MVDKLKLEELVLYLDARLRRMEESIRRLEKLVEPSRAEKREKEAVIYG